MNLLRVLAVLELDGPVVCERPNSTRRLNNGVREGGVHNAVSNLAHDAGPFSRGLIIGRVIFAIVCSKISPQDFLEAKFIALVKITKR